MSCHQKEEQETLPSMGWQRAHSQIISNHPNSLPPLPPSPLPPIADSSFQPNLTLQSPHSPKSPPGSSITPPPILLCSSGQLPLPELSTHHHRPCKLVRLSQQPTSFHAHPQTPEPPLPTARTGNSPPPHSVPLKSLTPPSAKNQLLLPPRSFSLLLAATTTLEITLVCGGEVTRGLRQLHVTASGGGTPLLDVP